MKFRFKEKRQNRVLSVRQILPEIMKDFELEESFIFKKVKNLWPVIIGNVIAAHSIPDRIFKKTLFISVDHPIYSNEILMLKDMIIKKLNDELGFSVIFNIRAEVKNIKWTNH